MPNALPSLAFAPGAGDVVLDADALLEFGLFTEGISRSGKSTLVRLLLEQTYGHVAHLVCDVEGEYLNLRSAARPYLIVGAGRDVPMPAGDAAVRAVVLKLADLGQSAILDLSELEEPEQQAVVAAACDALARRPTDAAGDVLVVLPELQDFAPEGGGKASALDAVRRLAKRGAKRGARLLADSQRVSDVSKGVIAQLKNKAIGLTDRADVRRAGEELGLPIAERGALTSLAQGTFYVKSPAVAPHAVLVRVPRPETLPPPRRRGERPAPPAEAPAEIAALAASLREQADATEQEAADVEQLRAQVRELRTQLAERPSVAADPAAVAAAEQHGREAAMRDLRALARGEVAELRACAGQLLEVATNVAGAMRLAAAVFAGEGPRTQEEQGTTRDSRAEVQVGHTEQDNGRHTSPGIGHGQPSARTRGPVATPAPDGAGGRSMKRSGTQQRLVNALALFAQLGQPSTARAAMAGVCGVSHTTGSFSNNVSALRTAGLVIDHAGGALSLTAAGRAAVTEVPAVRSVADVHALWRSRGRLSGTQWRIPARAPVSACADGRPLDRAATPAPRATKARVRAPQLRCAERALGALVDGITDDAAVPMRGRT